MPEQVEEPKPKRHLLSPSQVETWRGCKRKWGFKYIDRVPDTQAASAALGTAVHAMLEAYLRDGTPLPYSSQDPKVAQAAHIAAQLIPHIPAQGSLTDEHVERHFEIEIDGVPWQGYIDIAVDVEEGKLATLYDHKTTSDLKYAKTEEDLRGKDLQAALYAYWAMSQTGVRMVQLKWNYTLTRGGLRAKPVHTTVMGGDIAHTISAGVADGKEILNARATVQRALDLPPTPGHCGAFGGCAYAGLCNLSPAQRLQSNTGADDMSAVPDFDDLFADMGISTPVAAKPSAPPNLTPKPSSVALTPTPAPILDSVDAFLGDEDTPAGADLGRAEVNPPERQPPPPEDKSDDDVMAGSVPTAAPVETPEVKAKRTRRTKAQIEADNAAVQASREAPAIAGTPVPDAPTSPVHGAPSEPTSGYILCVNCAPVGFDGSLGLESYEKMSVEVSRVLQKEHNLSDFRYGNFGQGKATYQAVVKFVIGEYLKAAKGVFVLTLTTDTEEGALAFAVLAPLATLVIRGVR